MSARSEDFPLIQTRLRALGMYDLPIDDEWGPGMANGVRLLLSEAEKTRGISPPAKPSIPSELFGKIPNAYAWLNDAGQLPRHLVIALSQLGVVEKSGAADSPQIMGWRDELEAGGIHVPGYSADSVPWCGLFVAWVMFKANRDVVDKPLWALSWSKWGQDGGQPELGDLLTFTRNGGGHVAFYIAEDREGYFHVLGGNQGDRVSISRIAKARLHACRQPPYQNRPASVQPRIVTASGSVSRNEA